jgi:hypothetical protein
MRLSGLKLLAGSFLAAILSVPAWAAAPALPGTLNYVEGQASIGREALNAKSVGSVDLQTGQTLTTETGKAEVLLTPGVFFRLGENSAATLVSPNLTRTEMALNNGEAIVEADEMHRDNVLLIQQDGATTQLLKTGVYGFNANSGEVRVFKGEALVQDGDRQLKVKGGHELDVKNTARLKTAKFDEKEYEQADLYRFSQLRSEYLAEANWNAARTYVGGPGWYGAGWYWDPFFTAYTWIPGSGIFWSPFGWWGFYSPFWVGYAPYYYPIYPYGFYGGYYATARPFEPHHGPFGTGHAPLGESGFRGPSRSEVGAPHFGVMGEGFRGSQMAGGFNGGGGGFHGGGFEGGGFHR